MMNGLARSRIMAGAITLRAIKGGKEQPDISQICYQRPRLDLVPTARG
jgi:hypothetical protein